MPRTLVREDFIKTPVYDGTIIKRWVFYYSDGEIETVTVTERAK